MPTTDKPKSRYEQAAIEVAAFKARDVKNDTNNSYVDSCADAALALLKTHFDQRHSGSSSGITVSLFNRLVTGLPLLPLTGDDDEWWDPQNPGSTIQQNTRCSRVMRIGTDNATAFDVEAIRVVFLSLKVPTRPVVFPYMPQEPVVEHKTVTSDDSKQSDEASTDHGTNQDK